MPLPPVLCVLLLAACGEPEEVTRGREVYGTYCALCHGANGEGYDSPRANALTNEDFLVSATDAFLTAGIEQGRSDTKMSAFGEVYGGPLSDRKVSDLIAFFRYEQAGDSVRLSGGTISGDALAGASIYAEDCALCHGESGEGDTALSLSNPVFLATASDGFIEYAIRHGRRGTAMQGYSGHLSDQDIDNLVAFIRGWE